MLSTLGLGLLLAGRVGAFGSPTADAGRRGADDLVPARSLQEEVQEVAALKPITLRGGVLNAPPFAIDNGDGTYSGFQGDLLRRLSQFALEDDYNLTFVLSPSPTQYNEALNLVASDCNTTANPNPREECDRFDLIVGDYYCNADRSLRVDFSPTWLRTTMSAIKLAEFEGKGITTLTELTFAGGTACVPEGAYLSEVVKAKFPGASYNDCPDPEACIERLKSGVCQLYADDELALKYRALNDRSLEVTREQFNTQYIVWPLSEKMNPQHSRLLKKWMYKSVANATLDELSYDYFEVKFCPLGLSGPNCDQDCDPIHGLSDRDGRCICSSTKWTGADCSVEVEEDLNTYPPWEIAMCYSFFGINTLAVLVCASWIYWQRNTQQVKVWQPFFLYLVLLGCLVSSSSIIPAVQQSSEGNGNVPACMVFPWLFSVGFSITFGSLFAKIRRVYILFKAAVTMNRVTVTVKETFLICGILHLQLLEGLDSNHCRLALGVDDFCISAMLQDSQHRYQVFRVQVCGGRDDPKTGLFLRAAVIWMNDLFVICIIFGSLMHSVHFGPKKDVNIGDAVSEYARLEKESTTALKERKEKFVSRFSSIDSSAEPDGASVKRHSSGGGPADETIDVGSTKTTDVGSTRRLSAQISLASHPEKDEEDHVVCETIDDLFVEDDQVLK
ncbi:hypothetical protein THAOC_31318 [Thalassiosira oceanica]|uniref:Solute-binding protein family 3/N-terminal domain-containing protein n=1 Tax=Thalassiosira oceanica TaxID=159749 RepID=K0R8F8_THAOC|nr:hypothetical protein THAOC_31318 [Thalassiosira oceanica]|eukprot:EJK49773.1 hypothetical protein THAOC_31318 [Thalassiosira oceanica]